MNNLQTAAKLLTAVASEASHIPFGFDAECLENVPMISISSINYRILKTNYSAPSVTVARQDYWETICPQTHVNTNINLSLFNYTSGLTNLTFYYGCASINIPGLNSSSQPCDTNNDNVTYVVGSLPFDPVANGTCKNGVSIPVFTTAALALEANRTTIQEQWRSHDFMSLRDSYKL